MSKLIPLTKGQFTIVDDADFDWLSRWKWYASTRPSGKFYAARRDQKLRTVYLHRAILEAPAHLQIDHTDLNTLNNQRTNLRLCTHAENERNKPKLKGVSCYKGVILVPLKAGGTHWRAQIGLNGKRLHLGYFDSELDAARAYDTAALTHFGEFARLNFPAV